MKEYPKDWDRVVNWFSDAMRSKLALVSHKGDWRGLTSQDLYDYAGKEMSELQEALLGGNVMEIVMEAVDVAVSVMMAADIANGSPRPIELEKALQKLETQK